MSPCGLERTLAFMVPQPGRADVRLGVILPSDDKLSGAMERLAWCHEHCVRRGLFAFHILGCHWSSRSDE